MKGLMIIIMSLLIINIASAHVITTTGEAKIMIKTNYDIGKEELNYINDIDIIYNNKDDNYIIIIKSDQFKIKPPLNVKYDDKVSTVLYPINNNYYYDVRRGELNSFSLGTKSIHFTEFTYINLSTDVYGNHIISLTCDGINQDNILLYYNESNYKYGAVGEFNGLKNCSYIINSSVSVTLNDNGFIAYGSSMINNNIIIREYREFLFGDICDRYFNESGVIINPDCVFSQYDDGNNTITRIDFLSNNSIDPTITLTNFSLYGVINNNTLDEGRPLLHTAINDTDLLLYMPFDLSGAYDYSNNNNDGKITGATYTTNGAIGGAYLFDGNDKIETTRLITDDISVSLWAKRNGNCVGTYPSIIGQGYNYGYVMMWGNSGINLYIHDGVSYKNTGLYSISNDWHHLAFTTDDSKARLYVDGVNVDNLTTGNPDIRETIVTQLANYGTYYFNGTIDEVMIWNRTLSDNDIINIYNNQSSRYYNYGEAQLINFNVSRNNTVNKANITLSSIQEYDSKVSVRLREWNGTGYLDDTYSTGDTRIIAHYHFDNISYYENTNQAWDFSNNGNNMSCVTCPSIVNGYYGLARYYNRSLNQRFVLPSPLVSQPDLTEGGVSAWVRYTGSGLSDVGIFSGGQAGGQAEWQGLSIQNANQVRYNVDDGDDGCGLKHAASPANVMSDKLWHHVVGTFIANQSMKLYFDGELVATTSLIGCEKDINSTVFWSVGYMNLFADGLYIDEVIVYNTSIDQDDVTRLYVTGLLLYNKNSNYETIPEGVNQSVEFDLNDDTIRALFELNLSSSTNGFYSPVVYDDIIYDYYEESAPPSDSCDYTGGNHIYQGSDNCVISTDTDYDNNNVICNGSGTITINAIMTNINQFNRINGCHVIINTGLGGKILI